MFKKYTSKIILVAGLFVIFFCFNPVSNVFAYTEIFSDDFDSYNLGDGLSGKNGYYTGGSYNLYISDDVFLSSPYSLKIPHFSTRLYRDLTDDYTGLEQVYIEQDVYLSGDWSYYNINFNEGYILGFSIGFNSNKGTHFRSNASESEVIIDNDTTCSSNDYCQSWFKLGLNVSHDKNTNTLYYSVYIDNVFMGTYVLTDYTSDFYTFIVDGPSSGPSVYIDNLVISDTIPSNDPDPIDGVCGTSDGQTYSYPTTLPEDFCSAGELITPSLVYDGYGWTWSCSGLYGGESVSCEAYNSSPVDAVCGADDGGTFSSTSEMTEACSVGSLIFPSFVETSSGWTWICAGINGGSQAYCSATLSTTTYPTLPTQEDCSSYTFPDKWICEIKNLLTSAFLPSESKLNELNIAINSFQGKAPFNYLSSASNKFNDLKNGISESDLNITLMSNTSEVNLNDLTGLYDVIKGFFTIMVVLAFIFWGVGYIKHFFK